MRKTTWLLFGVLVCSIVIAACGGGIAFAVEKELQIS
jgi:hypothetical protein